MKVFLLILCCCNTIETYCIRGHSVVWRNSDDRVVKKVVFSKNARLRPYYPNEKKELEDLEYGFEYFAQALEPLQKIIITKKSL